MLEARLDYRPEQQNILQPLAQRARRALQSCSIVLVRQDESEEIVSTEGLMIACEPRARGLGGIGLTPANRQRHLRDITPSRVSAT